MSSILYMKKYWFPNCDSGASFKKINFPKNAAALIQCDSVSSTWHSFLIRKRSTWMSKGFRYAGCLPPEAQVPLQLFLQFFPAVRAEGSSACMAQKVPAMGTAVKNSEKDDYRQHSKTCSENQPKLPQPAGQQNKQKKQYIGNPADNLYIF